MIRNAYVLVGIFLGLNGLTAALPCRAADGPTATRSISSPLLQKMGFGDMKPVSDLQGRQVRGKGFFLPNGQQILSAGQLDFRSYDLAIQHTVQFRKSLDFLVNLQEFRQQLGPSFESIDLTNVTLKISRVVDFAETFNLNANVTSLQGSNVVFGAPIRVVGGVFPN